MLAKTSSYADGLWMVDLSGVRDADLVPATAASALELTLSGSRPTVAALTAQLTARELVVVLDNCEHVIDAAATLVRAIIQDCPGITVLATSREPLHLPGEVAWRVPSLRVPDPSEPIDSGRLMRYESVQLFVTRAQEAAPAFRLDDDNARVVAHICQRLDGMPLAIELAAAQAAYLAPKQIAALLDDALTTLASRIRDTPDRQATLAATVGWSFELLDADQRQLFPRLSVFAGGFTLDAAEQVASGGMARPLADVLAGLVDKSLVLAETLGAEEARYRLHEFVRQYAAQQLAQSGEALNLQRRHADWYCDRAESLDPDQGVPVVGEPSPWFAIERENLRVAMAHALKQMPERALRAAVAAWRSWMASGMHAEGSSGCAARLRRVLRCPMCVYARSLPRPSSKCALAGWRRQRRWVDRLPTSGDMTRIRYDGPRPHTFIACSAGWPPSGTSSTGSSIRQNTIFGACHRCGQLMIICGHWWRCHAATQEPHSLVLTLRCAGSRRPPATCRRSSRSARSRTRSDDTTGSR